MYLRFVHPRQCYISPYNHGKAINVFAVGAKPIMAEHPAEVAEITATSKALAVNLGNITDTRMKSIMISGKTALEKNIPSIIDIVGVACSNLRLDFTKKFINEI